jgi:uncharacterized protein with PIN domain
MSQASFRFYAQLNDFLPLKRWQIAFTHQFEESPSIKDMIESLGVPHAEVHAIVVNGTPTDFAYRVHDGDRISVYPAFTHIDGAQSIEPAEDTRFVLDVHLGRLAAYLRALGYDTLYRNDYLDPELAQISSAEDRVLLTRDLGLLKRSLVKRGYFVRNTNPARQLAEVMRQFNLNAAQRSFYRCLRCNGLLEVVDKATILDRLTDRTQQYYDEFRICRSCDQIFWKGSHFQKMQRLIERILSGDDPVEKTGP